VTNWDEGIPDEDEAMMTLLFVFASKAARSFSFKSSFSGAFWQR
jgi:hypothetical protein